MLVRHNELVTVKIDQRLLKGNYFLFRERYVVLSVSYSVIGYSAILIIYIVNEKRFTGALQNERDIRDIDEFSLESNSIDVHWFSIE